MRVGSAPYADGERHPDHHTPWRHQRPCRRHRELINCVRIALGCSPLEDCPVFDANSDEAVTVDELVRAVNNALNGCE